MTRACPWAVRGLSVRAHWKTVQVQVMDLETLMGRLGGAPGRADSLLHLEMTPRRAAKDATWPDWLGDPVREAFAGHRRTQSVVAPAGWPPTSRTAASTRSSPRARRPGSRCATCLPGLQAIESARGPKGQRGASVLYLAPTKALAQDQLAALQRLDLPDLRCSTHDGDSHARAAPVDPRPRGVRPDQPRHAAPLPAAGSCALVAVLRLAPLRRGRRVPPLPRRLRRPRRPDPAAAAASRRAVRRTADVRAGLGHRRRAGGLRRAAHRARRRRGHRRRFAPGPHGPRAVGAAVRARSSGRTAPRSAAPPPARSPTCSPTSSWSGSARSPSSAPGEAPRPWR